MTLNLTIPQTLHTDFTPRITVIGVGGGGTNAVDNMIASNLQGVEFVVANTDAQQLLHSKADRRIQLGPHITQGLGAGAKPEIGRAAAEEAADELYRHLDGAHMCFITAGMGGGTGTGAAPVIARMARERNILTVGVVTKPFTFEGSRRARAAEAGIEELQQYVDTLIVIPNQNLFLLANERTGWKEAFKMADNVLYMGVRGVTDLMVAPGLVNLDFADIRTVMAEMGKAMMGTGEAEGENRSVRAAEAAISNPLLEDTSMAGARGLLINITGGEDMTLFEVDQAANRIRQEVDEEANIIFGSAIDERLNGKIRVSVVATGIESPSQKNAERPRLVAVGGAAPISAVAVTPVPAMAEAGASVGGSAPLNAPLGAPQVGSSRAPGIMGFGQRTPQRPGIAPLTSLPRVSRPGGPEFTPGQSPGQAGEAEAEGARPRLASGTYEQQSDQSEAMPQMMSTAAATIRPGVPPRAAARLGAGQPRTNGLFAEGAKADAPVTARKSLFGIVTGAIRGGNATLAAETPSSRGGATTAEPRSEPARPAVRPATGEEIGIEIPAFLRRQSS